MPLQGATSAAAPLWPSAAAPMVSLEDLQAALQDLLDTKSPPAAQPPAATAKGTAPRGGQQGSRSRGRGRGTTPGTGPDEGIAGALLRSAAAHAHGMGSGRTPFQPALAGPPNATAAATATTRATAKATEAAASVSTAPAVQEVFDQDLQQPGLGSDTSGAEGFGGLSAEFLGAMQVSLEELGYDLTSPQSVQTLAEDPGLPNALVDTLAAKLAGAGISKKPAVVSEMARRWQRELQRQMKQEKELARKGRRPVWRCGVCGRYGCPVAPYIERYEDV